MPNELFPILSTPDLERSLGFYRDALGGSVTYEFPAEGGGAAYVSVRIGAGQIGIALDAAARHGAGPVSVWVYVDDCDRSAERLRSAGVPVVAEPADQPWGERIARVLDPDGVEVILAEHAEGAEGSAGLGAALMSPEPERYTRPEYERRFLVSPSVWWRDRVGPHSKTLEDIYFRHTHLRLRTLTDSATGREFIKLTKKLTSDSPYAGMIGSIPLSPMEYELLSHLEGDRVRKVRHYHFHRGEVFAIDVFEGALEGLVLCEVETGSFETLMRIDLPDYAATEVTEDPFFTGGSLARTSADALTEKLAGMGLGGGGR